MTTPKSVIRLRKDYEESLANILMTSQALSRAWANVILKASSENCEEVRRLHDQYLDQFDRVGSCTDDLLRELSSFAQSETRTL
jgi:hypothetical protein